MGREIRYQGAIVRDDHILLIKHRHHEDGRSYWLLPGGGIEADEGEEACVAREMVEETNLRVRVGALLLDEPARPGDVYQRFKTYLCEVVEGEARPGYEPEEDAAEAYGIVEVGWFDLRDTAGWDGLLREDGLTFPLMERVRAALGYGLPASAPIQPGAIVLATADRQPTYPDPLVLCAGDEVMVGREDTEWVGWLWCTNGEEKSGWVPKRYIWQNGDRGKMLVDYTTAELPIQAGETLTLHNEESGWYWATNAAGENGWVPATHIR